MRQAESGTSPERHPSAEEREARGAELACEEEHHEGPWRESLTVWN